LDGQTTIILSTPEPCPSILLAGAIDVEELQYALELMGIQKSAADVQELMDSVDKDGSGELTVVASVAATGHASPLCNLHPTSLAH
jgi:hypothetical protein